MKWITRERPKIDRIACPWLIKKMVDTQAEFLYVPFNQVLPTAQELHAIPFDVPGAHLTHYNEYCTFDAIIKEYNIKDPAIDIMALIVRAADTDRHQLAAEAPGLWAISAGLSHNYTNDQEQLQQGMILYDALYSWAKYHYKEKHTQQPFEKLLLEVYHTYLDKKTKGKKTPAWVKELKELMQDQIDTNISLKEISKDLDINAAYLSREFSKYFDNLSFGDYLRKQRIEKAIDLFQNPDYTLTDIAYLTGFSDQSHFTRIFKKHTGKNPSAYRKALVKK